MDAIKTFNLEEYVLRSFNYLERMVDKDGLPYFNIFWTEPAEAAHDWPDYGDVMARQLQAAIMARHMTGKTVAAEKLWLHKIQSFINSDSGLLENPESNFSNNMHIMGTQALTLYALVTSYIDKADENLKKKIFKMVDAVSEVFDKEHLLPGILNDGFILKALMVCARYLNCETALKLAGKIVDKIFNSDPEFTPDNTFGRIGHTHSNLRTLVGAADYALYTGNPVIYSRVEAIFRFLKSRSASFGFIPETTKRKDDIVGCETCTIMDYIGIAATLANHGHPEYWGVVERTVRNHMAESQVKDASWLKPDTAGKDDTYQFTWTNVGERMVGGYAGWSSPNHILAAGETLHWGGPELREKIRAFQNCCGGSGVHAFFIAWKNAARFENGCLTVNMHFDKLLPQAEIRGYQPFKGLLAIKLKQACNIKVRIPDFVNPEDLKIESDNGEIGFVVFGNYVQIAQRAAGEVICIKYPVSVTTEEISVGNPGAMEFKYSVTWKGDTVINIKPMGSEVTMAYSRYDKKEVPVFYGKEGPGLLYVREYMTKDIVPEPADIHMDEGSMDFWRIERC